MPSLDSKKAEKIGGTLADSENFFELESSIARLKKREALLALYQSKPIYHLYTNLSKPKPRPRPYMPNIPKIQKKMKHVGTQTCQTLPKPSCHQSESGSMLFTNGDLQ